MTIVYYCTIFPELKIHQAQIFIIKTDLDSELMLFNEEANEVIYVLA